MLDALFILAHWINFLLIWMVVDSIMRRYSLSSIQLQERQLAVLKEIRDDVRYLVSYDEE